ncbi:AAA family ATPase [Pseudanabaenaceae cyanobacterium LEGE 13415]|nr:AAA family ATPase [Pseudanabaenaceae cyanobacterium LEGE 13415]
MVASYNAPGKSNLEVSPINPKHDGIMLMEMEEKRQFEDRILKTSLRNLWDPAHRKHYLTQIARSYDTSIDAIEEIAQLLMNNMGVDLEEQEFTSMVNSVRDIESIVDEGLRNFKLSRLAKRLRMPKTDMMNSYYKALINQAPFVDYTLDQLDQLCTQVKDWLVSGWIPSGIVLLLHALGGAGKSLMVYELIECIVKGQPWNGYQTKPGRVLILQSDEPVIVTRERMQLRDLTREYPVTVVPGWQVENMARLEARLKEYAEMGDPVRLCMVDSVTAINRNTLISENDTEYARFMLQLNDLGDRYGCTFIVIHHSNSDGESRGTKALYNSASEVWGLMVADEQTGDRVLRVQKTRMGRPPGRYKFQFEEDRMGFVYLGREGDESREDDAHSEKRIELWLNEDEHRGIGYEVEEIAEYLGLNKNTVRKVLKEMWAKGTVMRYPSGHRKALAYHVGERRSIDRLSIADEGSIDRRSIGDQYENPENIDVSAPNDLSIAKSEQFSLLQNRNSAIDRSLEAESPEIREKVIDRAIDRLSIAPDLIDTAIDRIDPGDLVLPNGTCVWHRNGSDKLPWQKVPKSYRNSKTIPIEVLERDLFFELTDVSRVIAINGDRVKVRNQKTGRNSVYLLKDVALLRKENAR